MMTTTSDMLAAAGRLSLPVPFPVPFQTPVARGNGTGASAPLRLSLPFPVQTPEARGTEHVQVLIWLRPYA